MRARKPSLRLCVALAAAWLMLVQSVAGSFAAAATHPTFDAFGNPLCMTSADHGQPAEDHHKLPGCCILGCGAFASGFAAPRAEDWLEVAFSTEPAWHARPSPTLVPRSDEHVPGSPRGPPAAG